MANSNDDDDSLNRLLAPSPAPFNVSIGEDNLMANADDLNFILEHLMDEPIDNNDDNNAEPIGYDHYPSSIVRTHTDNDTVVTIKPIIQPNGGYCDYSITYQQADDRMEGASIGSLSEMHRGIIKTNDNDNNYQDFCFIKKYNIQERSTLVDHGRKELTFMQERLTRLGLRLPHNDHTYGNLKTTILNRIDSLMEQQNIIVPIGIYREEDPTGGVKRPYNNTDEIRYYDYYLVLPFFNYIRLDELDIPRFFHGQDANSRNTPKAIMHQLINGVQTLQTNKYSHRNINHDNLWLKCIGPTGSGPTGSEYKAIFVIANFEHWKPIPYVLTDEGNQGLPVRYPFVTLFGNQGPFHPHKYDEWSVGKILWYVSNNNQENHEALGTLLIQMNYLDPNRRPDLEAFRNNSWMHYVREG